LSIGSAKKINHQWKFFALVILCLPLSSFSMSAQQRTTNDQPFVPSSTNDSRTKIPIITVAEEKMFPQSWRSAPISARATNLSTREVQRSLEVLNRAMGKYPESFLHENIKRIYLLGSLNLYGVPCDGTISSDSLYIVNGGGKEYTDEYIALTFHYAFSNLISEKNRKTRGGDTPDVVRVLPQRGVVALPSADRLMKLVYEDDQGGPGYIYALEKTGFIGLTLLKQFKNSPARSAIKCLIRCSELSRRAPSALIRAAIKQHSFSQHWTIEDVAPVWSHDDKQIAFSSGRDNDVNELYVMRLDGSNIRRLTHSDYSPYQSIGFSPAVWSPDDRQLAYVMHAGGPSKLFVANADGSGQKQLSVDKPTNSGIFLLGWLPDRRILFLTEGLDRSRTIYSILPDGSGLTALTEKSTVVSEAHLSPNHGLLAMTANGNLVIKDLKTNELLSSTNGTAVGEFAWSPDSKRIVYDNGGSLMLIDLKSNAIRHLGDANRPGPQSAELQLLPPWKIFDISWSPDGKQIAFGLGSALVQNSVSPTELRLISVDGAGTRVLAANGYSPVWSPDGKYIVFSRRQARLYIVRADGSDERYLASGVQVKWLR